MKITHVLRSIPDDKCFTEVDICFGKGIEIYAELNQVIDITYQNGKLVVEILDKDKVVVRE